MEGQDCTKYSYTGKINFFTRWFKNWCEMLIKKLNISFIEEEGISNDLIMCWNRYRIFPLAEAAQLQCYESDFEIQRFKKLCNHEG